MNPTNPTEPMGNAGFDAPVDLSTLPDPMTSEHRVDAACRGLPSSWWYPRAGADLDGDNHGAAAKAVCASCPVREACLVGALARNEEHGIWGGAGEPRRRVLRRAMRAGMDRLAEVAAAHWRQLDGVEAPGDRDLLAGLTVDAVHGNAVTYARGGCRCDACSLAVAIRGNAAKVAGRGRTTGVAA